MSAVSTCGKNDRGDTPRAVAIRQTTDNPAGETVTRKVLDEVLLSEAAQPVLPQGEHPGQLVIA